LRSSGQRDRQLHARGGARGLRPRRGRGGNRPARAGRFTEGTALEIDALLAAGIEHADAFVASTDGDNTNLVIAQIARRRFEVERVVVRVLDPARARWYAEQGLQTVCPTQTAIELLEAAVRGQIRFEGVSG
jgi:trk system potassium uptake protein